MNVDTQIELAEKIQKACIDAAREGFHDAAMSGLCAEGAVETAIGSIEKLDLEIIIQEKE